METILVLTDDVEQVNAQLVPMLQQIYSAFNVKVRQIDADLLTDLLTGTPPLMILADSCNSSLSILKELKSHPRLHSVPVLMLRAVATLQKVHVEHGTEKKLTNAFTLPKNYALN